MAKMVKYSPKSGFQPEMLRIKYVQKHIAHNYKTKCNNSHWEFKKKNKEQVSHLPKTDWFFSIRQ